MMLAASALTCFERRLGCLDSGTGKDAWTQRLIDANMHIFDLSLKLSFAWLPWYKLLATPTWRRLLQAEDFFFG